MQAIPFISRSELPERAIFGTDPALKDFLNFLVMVDECDYSEDELGNDLVTTLCNHPATASRAGLEQAMVNHIAARLPGEDRVRIASVVTPLVECIWHQVNKMYQWLPAAWVDGQFRFAFHHWRDYDMVLQRVA